MNVKAMDLFDRVISLDKGATDFGFTWEHHSQLVEQLLSECEEVKEVIDHPHLREHLEDELGDLIFTAIALCVYCKFDPKVTLNKSLDKFQKRFHALKEISQKEGFSTLSNQPMTVLKDLWDKAKQQVKSFPSSE